MYDVLSDPNVEVKTSYWQEGITVDYQVGSACVESVQGHLSYRPGLEVAGRDGVLITVQAPDGNFAVLGFMVDQIEALIAQWYPG